MVNIIYLVLQIGLAAGGGSGSFFSFSLFFSLCRPDTKRAATLRDRLPHAAIRATRTYLQRTLKIVALYHSFETAVIGDVDGSTVYFADEWNMFILCTMRL